MLDLFFKDRIRVTDFVPLRHIVRETLQDLYCPRDEMRKVRAHFVTLILE